MRHTDTRFIFIGLSLIFCLFLTIFLLFKKGSEGNDFSRCNLNSTPSTFKDFQGDFSLINVDGLNVTSDVILEKPSLLYFGYTFCPDICPFDLMRNSQAVDLLDTENIKVTPIFISIDPERDTPSVLKEFTEFHHPNMMGLTGSKEQLDNVKKIYRVYSEIPRNTSQDYIVNHSTFSYFLLPGEGVQTYFTRKQTPEELADTIKCITEIKFINK